MAGRRDRVPDADLGRAVDEAAQPVARRGLRPLPSLETAAWRSTAGRGRSGVSGPRAAALASAARSRIVDPEVPERQRGTEGPGGTSTQRALSLEPVERAQRP
ncbi:hypothetical protein NDU88_005124 [Pleurodeles waltl]|uniref:Uncharacterized protein n=1 Tax=Pleurodeles waltl TaxID=8319 RepID=A0AAV7PLR3_PLEWA|nr:hypothetical protein NDU88_005124 [Pleurodeles waltl]